jgi:hypothetical protein
MKMNNLQTLHSFKKCLVEYLKLKVEQEDWHGVSDAANDIREVDAKIATLKEVKEENQRAYVTKSSLVVQGLGEEPFSANTPKDTIPKDHPLMKHSK